MRNERVRATVSRVVSGRGFGFCEVDNEPVFVHVSDFVAYPAPALTPGLEVEFALEDTDRGKRARRIEVVGN